MKSEEVETRTPQPDEVGTGASRVDMSFGLDIRRGRSICASHSICAFARGKFNPTESEAALRASICPSDSIFADGDRYVLRTRYAPMREVNSTRRSRTSSHSDFIHLGGFHLPKADFTRQRRISGEVFAIAKVKLQSSEVCANAQVKLSLPLCR